MRWILWALAFILGCHANLTTNSTKEGKYACLRSTIDGDRLRSSFCEHGQCEFFNSAYSHLVETEGLHVASHLDNLPIHLKTKIPFLWSINEKHGRRFLSGWRERADERCGDNTVLVDRKALSSDALFGFVSNDTPLFQTQVQQSELVIVDDVFHDGRTKNWLREAFSSLSSINFNNKHPRILAFVTAPTSRYSFGKGPVRFGSVRRGVHPTLLFVVEPTTSENELRNDWVAFHEFSHLVIPRLPYSARWLNEGLATYFQYVLLFQRGRINEDEFWREIQAGFERGASVGSGALLEDESREMIKNRTFYRVYWTGTLYWMELADKLAKQGRQLSEVIRLCAFHRSEIEGALLIARIDEQVKGSPAANLFREYRNMRAFPAARAKAFLESLREDEEETSSKKSKKLIFP